MIKYCSFIIILSILFCKTQNSGIHSFEGDWWCEIPNNLRFKCIININNDTLYLKYDNLLLSDGFINSYFDSSNYALILPIKGIDSNQEITTDVINYYDGEQHSLNLQLEQGDSVLLWRIVSTKAHPYLPNELKLKKHIK